MTLADSSVGGTGAPEHLLDMGMDSQFLHQGIQLVAIDGGGEQYRRDLQIPSPNGSMSSSLMG